MGQTLTYTGKNAYLNMQPEKISVQRAIMERDLFLKNHPKLKTFQIELDRRLDQAGTCENRLLVLSIMIQSNLMDLNEKLSKMRVMLNCISFHT